MTSNAQFSRTLEKFRIGATSNYSPNHKVKISDMSGEELEQYLKTRSPVPFDPTVGGCGSSFTTKQMLQRTNQEQILKELLKSEPATKASNATDLMEQSGGGAAGSQTTTENTT